MYVPADFAETRVEVLHQLIHDHPLAVLVTQSTAGVEANHVPLEIDAEPRPYGTLTGHVARSNPVWREAQRDVESLAIFQGPHGYVSPGWYPTKTDTGKVVPTWNYAVVHAYGRLRVIDDPTWLRAFLDRLTTRHEFARPTPWQVTDAPAAYIDAMVRQIVGFELVVTRLVGKWKLSQNRTPEDRAGVVEGLRGQGDASSLVLAALMERR